MSITSLIFGARPKFISEPPRNAQWREASPLPSHETVRAHLAAKDEPVDTGQGNLRARKGKDMIVEYDNGDRAVVRRSIFESTYEPAEDGRYRKRADVRLRYFTLDGPAIVETLEGRQRAAAGDWIMEGAEGELWPVPREKAKKKYRTH